MDAQTIKQLIEQGIDGASAEVLGDDGQHFQARVVAAAFTGINTVKRHQMVYGALGGRMGTEIHALSLRTLAPDEA